MTLWIHLFTPGRHARHIFWAALPWPALRPVSRWIIASLAANETTHSRKRQRARIAAMSAASLVLGVFASQQAHGQCVSPPCFQGLGDLPGGGPHCEVAGISKDGGTVVGMSSSANGSEAFRWTVATGLQGLGDAPGGAFISFAVAASFDGSVIVGRCRTSNINIDEAFRWTSGEGIVPLGDLPGGIIHSAAWCVSSNGAVIAGNGQTANGTEAFRWTSATGMVGLGDLGGGIHDSNALGISQDGSILFGFGTSTEGREAFRWTQSTGMVGLGDFPGGEFHSTMANCTADGLMAVGDARIGGFSQAFRWTPQSGMVLMGDIPGGLELSVPIDMSPFGELTVGAGFGPQSFEAVIWDSANNIQRVAQKIQDAGAFIPAGWTLTKAVGVALNSNVVTIVGNGINPQGNTEGWIARYSLVPGCEPADVVQSTSATTVSFGDSVQLNVAAGGTGLSYQWRKGGVNLTDGPAICGGSITGATADTLVLNTVIFDDAGSYDVVVSNACGTDTSAAATLTIGPPPATADIDRDGQITTADIQALVDALLAP